MLLFLSLLSTEAVAQHLRRFKTASLTSGTVTSAGLWPPVWMADCQSWITSPVAKLCVYGVLCALCWGCFFPILKLYSPRSTGAGHIIRISSKSWFISLIPFKKWNLYNVYIHSTQTDIFQVFISFNFDDYKWKLMKTPNSVSQKIRISWKGSILKTPGATL